MVLVRAAQRSETELVREVAACVRDGGTVIFPTETVYGIGCSPENDAAIAAIFTAKSRSTDKPLALHIADMSQALGFVEDVTECAHLAMQRLWPGPVAIIVRRRADRFVQAAGGRATISLRCPDHAVALVLLRACGPLAATSANLSGRSAFTGDEDDLRALPDATLAVLAGPTTFRRESTIVDCTSDTPVILREGAVPATLIHEKLGTSSTAR